MLIELDPVDRITTDAVGPPGSRVFFLQGRQGDRLITLLMEKEQVQLLAASVVEILSRVGKETGQGPPEEQMGLDEPLVPEWRAGRLSIGYHDERDLLMLEVEESVPADTEEDEEGEGEEEGMVAFHPSFGVEESAEEEAGDDEEPVEDPLAEGDDPSRVRFWATREQMLSLARHGASVCAAGRPRCPLCHNPMDPEGHQCPALNGHRSRDD